MTCGTRSNRGVSKPLVTISVAVAAIVIALLFFAAPIRRAVRESLMQSVTSAHYEVLCSAGAVSQDAMTDFAMAREKLFTALDKKLGDAASNQEIRIIFDPDFPAPASAGAAEPLYSVSGTTNRVKLNGRMLQVPAAADAQALLNVVWGKPGNPKIAEWTALWLAGDWRGAEIGMAAAEVEQRLGHKPVAVVLGGSAAPFASGEDETLLGAAWMSEVAEFGGADAVRKLYSAKMGQPSVTEVTRILGTSPLELDRKWQMWMFAYLAGMPATQQNSGIPMKMPMDGMH